MPIVYVVPGFCASKLVFNRGILDEAWPAPLLLTFGQIKHLALAPNGIDPAQDGGEYLRAATPTYHVGEHRVLDDGFLLYFYQPLIQQLERQLSPHGYRVVPWPYDWRLRIKGLGLELALQIRRDYPVNGPCTIMAHSMGGLVSRVAWWSLAQTQQSHMVRRLITLASPHQGSYTTVSAILGYSPVIDGILYLNALTAGLPGVKGGVARTQLNADQIVRLATTWPAVYDLLPIMGSPDSVADTNRSRLFTATNWSPLTGVSQAHLTYARDSWSRLLLSPTAVPPYSVLTTIAGHGYGSLGGLANPAPYIAQSKLGYDGDTDTTVTAESAIIPRSRTYHLSAQHLRVPGVVALEPWLSELVLEDRSDTDPTAPVVYDTLVYASAPPWPPIQERNWAAAPNLCQMGMCQC